jgi:hypothetical protein
MAIVVRNILLKGLQGSLGKSLVFRQVGGKTIVSLYPQQKKKAGTEKQIKHRELFKMAVCFAKEVQQDENRMQPYKEKMRKGAKVFPFLVKEFFRQLAQQEETKMC